VLDGDELVLLLPSLDKSHMEGHFQFLRDHLTASFARIRRAAGCGDSVPRSSLLHRALQRVLVPPREVDHLVDLR